MKNQPRFAARPLSVRALFLMSSLIAAFALVSLAGCLDSSTNPVIPEPLPKPPATPTAAAAEFGRDYSRRLATTATELANRAEAGEFASLADLNDEWVRMSKTDREAAQSAIVESMNAALVDETGKQPGSVAAGLFRELASGFTKGSQK